ncbi:MAG: hypothetical protein JWP47_280 [Polaromonas sp.]|nr:hypothetical protein [Polaromonas sp.]
MMTKALELLQNCRSVTELRPLLHAICLGCGAVARVDILMSSQVGKRQALCFLRMATPQQEELLMRELGVGRFGGDIVVIVDLKGAESADPCAATAQRGLMNNLWDAQRFTTVCPESPEVLAEPFMTPARAQHSASELRGSSVN